MNTKLLVAVIILVGLGAAVFAKLGSRESATTIEKPTATLPTLKKEEIAAVEIQKPDKVQIKLQKQGDKWALTAPVAAEADQSAVDSVLEKLADLQVSSVAATRKENHKRLEVDPESAIHVLVKGAGDKTLADLWVGASKSGGTMVRVEGKDEVLATKGSIRYVFDKEPKLFRNREILDIDPAEFTAFALESEKGKFKFEKPADKWQQAKGEKAIARFSDAKVSGLVSSLARLRAADFAEPSEDEHAMGFDAPKATATLTKKDGTTIELQLGREHGNAREYYLRVVGNPVNYRISKYTAERMIADAAAFQEPEKKEGEAAPQPTAAAGGENQIPPEVLRQLQQQMGGAHP